MITAYAHPAFASAVPGSRRSVTCVAAQLNSNNNVSLPQAGD